jgi:hypothetical protein
VGPTEKTREAHRRVCEKARRGTLNCCDSHLYWADKERLLAVATLTLTLTLTLTRRASYTLQQLEAQCAARLAWTPQATVGVAAKLSPLTCVGV